MSKGNKQSFIQIYSNDTFDVYYDKNTKKYHIDVFNDGHYWDEVRFDVYKEDELNPKEIPMPVERFNNYNHEWWAGKCPRCNKMIRFNFNIDSSVGNRKCYCSLCGQLCDFEDV